MSTELDPGDEGLQPERTALAWRRLGLALVAGGLLASHLVADGHPLLGVVAGIGAAAVAAVLLVLSHLDLVHHERPAAAHRSPFPQLLLAAVAVLLLGVAGLTLAAG